MNTTAFEMLLDRLGTDFAVWPFEEAEQARAILADSEEARRSYDALRRIESLLEGSRPLVGAASVQKAIRGALFDIATREETPSLLERFRALLFAPLPRAAFAITMAASGFAVGIAVGNPNAGKIFDISGNLMTASADDVLF
jgi:hypothetical protein